MLLSNPNIDSYRKLIYDIIAVLSAIKKNDYVEVKLRIDEVLGKFNGFPYEYYDLDHSDDLICIEFVFLKSDLDESCMLIFDRYEKSVVCGAFHDNILQNFIDHFEKTNSDLLKYSQDYETFAKGTKDCLSLLSRLISNFERYNWNIHSIE